MYKFLSQAIKKAVSEYSPNIEETTKDKRPDLFSLSDQTELFQNSRGITIKIDRTKDANLTDFGKATLSDRYLGRMNLFRICLPVLQVIIQMTICMHKEFILILATYGLCLQLQFYQTVEQKEGYQFLVF